MLVAGVTAITCFIAVACTAAVSSIPVFDGPLLFSDVLTVAGLLAIAGMPGDVVSVIVFVRAFAGGPSLAGDLAVASILVDPGVPV